jgi:AAA domain
MRLVGDERHLARMLGEFGYDIHFTFDDLRRLAGQTANRRLPALTAQLGTMMETYRRKKLNYQPASELLHRIFDPNGTLGRVFEAAVAGQAAAGQAGLGRAGLGQAGAIHEVENCVETLPQDPTDIPTFIEAQALALLGRQAPIEGSSLHSLCKLLEAAFDLLRDWLGAARSERAEIDDRRRTTLDATVGQVRKMAEGLLEKLAAETEVGLAGAVSEVLRLAVQDLVNLCQGREPVQPAPRLPAGWGADLLRLPGGAQPRQGEGEAYRAERRAQREALYACLRHPRRQAATLAEAFDARLRDDAPLAAHDILILARRFTDLVPGLDPVDGDEQLAARIEGLRKSHRAEIERLSSQLAMLWHLAGADRDQIADSMQRLSVIETALAADLSGASDEIMIPALNGVRSAVVPPDFPELRVVLEQVTGLVERGNHAIIESQRRRLGELARQEPLRAASAALQTRMGEFDPVTVDSMIGQIQDGLPFAAIEAKGPDIFARFHPDFVSTAAASRETATRLVEAELKGRSVLNLPPCTRGPDLEKRALDLMHHWSSFGNAMKSGNGDQLRNHLINLLGTLGFVRSRLQDGTSLIRGRLHRFTLNAKVRLGRDQFLPPIYGTESRDLYNILIADNGVGDRELVTQLGSTGRDKPSFLIVLGRLDRRRRETLAHELRLERQTAVLLDESLILYLALGEDEPLETLFACGLPYGYIQPYTTKPRTIPPEMFFGRKDEIQRIVARQSGGCLIYGGRQLGKSALLNHVKQLYDNPETGHRVINLDIKPIGGRGVPADRIWRDLAGELHNAGVCDVKDYDAESFRTEVRAWLRAKPGRQLLIMLDEADNFLAAEGRNGSYANLHALKDLMETSNWDFKVVFAGLHNVRRMSRAANSPLPHLGTPICIGPLDSNADNLAEARRLVSAPMRAAGYDYIDPNLAFSILARVNYYPSLVQVFCHAVIENAGKVRRQPGSGPYWKLGRAELFEGAIWRSINDEIQTRFQVTLELDWRYEAIAKVIALHGSEGPEGNTRILRTGLSAVEIHDMVMGFWPDGIVPLVLTDFQILLEEMTDLGVLSDPVEGRYVLRNAQVAQLLGSREDLEQALLAAMAREEQVDYDPTGFHSPYIASAVDSCAPITDAQLDSLLDDVPNRGKVGALVVQDGLWDFHDPKGLGELIEMRSDPQRPVSVSLSSAEHQTIRSLIDARSDHPNERRILLIRGEWDAKVVEVLAGNARVRQGSLRPIWLLPASWLVLRLRAGDLPEAMNVVCARPWSLSMLRHWLDSHGLTRLDQPQLRDAILEATGGLPALLRAILPHLQRQTTQSPDALTAEIGMWERPTGRDGVRADLAGFGFNQHEILRIRELAMEALTSPDGTLDAAAVALAGHEAFIRPAEALGLLHRRQDRLALSPLGRLMTT